MWNMCEFSEYMVYVWSHSSLCACSFMPPKLEIVSHDKNIQIIQVQVPVMKKYWLLFVQMSLHSGQNIMELTTNLRYRETFDW